MYDYIKGVITELTPTELVLENNGIGYKILISIQSYSQLAQGEETSIYIYHNIRENTEQLFGFTTKEERKLFLHLIEVSGIGPTSARMMLSSLNSEEIVSAIITEDINKLKSIKGIGLKTAQRILIDLKDKITKGESVSMGSLSVALPGTKQREEAYSALILLGFSKNNVDKVLDSLLKENSSYTLEQLIKLALKRL